MLVQTADDARNAKVDTRRPQGVRAGRVTLAPLLLIVLAAALPASALAQQYKSDAVDDKALRSNLGAAQGCAKGTLNYATERPRVAEFFTKGYFPEMSRSEPVALGKLGDLRFNLFRRYLWATTNQQMQSDITEWAFDAMKRMASPGYHPAVRYNAILTMGMLDAQYGIDSGPNRRPPKPLPKANEFLTRVVAAAAGGSKAISPPLLAGALVGLQRHATYRDGLSPEAIAAMSAALLKIAEQDKPQLEVDSNVHAWFRLKAASVLAELGNVGPNNQVHDTLIKLVGDSKNLDDRCELAALFAKISYTGAKIDSEATTKQMLALARDVASDEAKRAEEFRDMRFAGGGGAVSSRSFRGEGGGYSGRGGGGYGYTGEEQEDYPRRPAVARLHRLRTGLAALKPAVPPEAQQKFDAIRDAVDPAITIAADTNSVALNVAGQMVSMASAVNRISKTSEENAPVADETAEFDEPVQRPAAPAPPAERQPVAAAPASAQ